METESIKCFLQWYENRGDEGVHIQIWWQFNHKQKLENMS